MSNALNNTWQPNARARCVHHWPTTEVEMLRANGVEAPRYGTIYLVKSILHAEGGVTWINLKGYPDHIGFTTTRFERIIPACDRPNLGTIE